MSSRADAVKDFYDYLIIGEEGLVGLRDDAPEEAKRAYAEYLDEERQEEVEGFIRLTFLQADS